MKFEQPTQPQPTFFYQIASGQRYSQTCIFNYLDWLMENGVQNPFGIAVNLMVDFGFDRETADNAHQDWLDAHNLHPPAV